MAQRLIIKTVRDQPPLYIACQNGHFDIVQELLKHNVDINCPNNEGATPLYMVCRNGHFDIVEELLNYKNDKININYKNGDLTPLLSACNSSSTHGKNKLFQILLEHGADMCDKYKEELTTLDVAFQAKNQAAISELLKNAKLKDYSPDQIMSAVSLKKAIVWAKENSNPDLEKSATTKSTA